MNFEIIKPSSDFWQFYKSKNPEYAAVMDKFEAQGAVAYKMQGQGSDKTYFQWHHPLKSGFVPMMKNEIEGIVKEHIAVMEVGLV